MATKSPYELRTELLAMAMAILEMQHRAAHSNTLYSRKEESEDSDKSVFNDDFGPMTAPTTEEIIVEASKLNEFIQTR